MTFRKALYLLLVILPAFPVLGSTQRMPVRRPLQPSAAARPLFVPGEVLVRFHGAVPASEMATIHAQNAGSVIRVNDVLNIQRVSTPFPVEEAVRQYRQDPRVEFAQPNYYAWPSLVPNDPFYDNFNAVPDDLQRWYLGPNNVDAETAWDTTTGRSDVVIAIIDSGIDLNHPELSALLWVNAGETPGNGTDDDGNGFIDDVNGFDFYTGPAGCCGNTRDADPNPDPGDGLDNNGDTPPLNDENTHHGTFVAGTACAGTNNSAEGAGAAWLCQLMALKVFTDDGGASFSDVIDAITYAANNGADVINMSLGTDAEDNLFCPVDAPLVEAAVTFAHNQGVVVVSSAGNENSTGSRIPASCTHSMSVGASDSGSVLFGGSGDIDGRAGFSNYGVDVDVVAPGVDIVSPWVCSQEDVNTGFAGCVTPGGQPVDSSLLPAARRSRRRSSRRRRRFSSATAVITP